MVAEENAHLRDRQFAENCDPLRAKQSQLAAKQAMLDQQAQVCSGCRISGFRVEGSGLRNLGGAAQSHTWITGYAGLQAQVCELVPSWVQGTDLRSCTQ